MMSGDKESKDDSSSKKKDNEVSMLTPEACPSGKEISDQDVEDVMGVVMGVSGVAGRKQGETLDLLRIQEEGEETPMSGSRMDFGEKKIFFQKKIEDQITSPSLRDRKWKKALNAQLHMLTFITSQGGLFVYLSMWPVRIMTKISMHYCLFNIELINIIADVRQC